MVDMRVGRSIKELDTPVLLVDLDLMDANIETMVGACRSHNIQWRPHAKCHKSPLIARRLVDAGAIGVTCAKLGEAEVMAAGGVRDLLIANLIVGDQKVERLVRLTEIADPIVCLDDRQQAIPLGRAMVDAGREIRVILELDIGLSRVGVSPGQAALELAQQVVATPGLKFAGVMGYEGHLLTISDRQEKTRQIHNALQEMTETVSKLADHGIDCEIVSCGGTGCYDISVAVPGITELQAGGAIFMDAFYRYACGIGSLQYALTVSTTVVSRPAEDRAIIDAGRKTMNGEIYMPRVLSRDDIQVDSLSAEHGKLALAPSADDLAIGDRLEMLPGYADLTINLHNELIGHRQGRVVEFIPVTARGFVR